MPKQRGRNDRRRRQGGFTLVELGVVLAILAILVAIAVPTYITMVNRAREAEAQQAWSMVKTALWSYYIENEEFPPAPNEWWDVIEKPSAANWEYRGSTSSDSTSATMVATLIKDSKVKRCWTIKNDGTVTSSTTNCP